MLVAVVEVVVHATFKNVGSVSGDVFVGIVTGGYRKGMAFIKIHRETAQCGQFTLKNLRDFLGVFRCGHAAVSGGIGHRVIGRCRRVGVDAVIGVVCEFPFVVCLVVFQPIDFPALAIPPAIVAIGFGFTDVLFASCHTCSVSVVVPAVEVIDLFGVSQQ